MKRIYLLCIVPCFLFFEQAAFSQVDLKKGLIAHYPFDGNAKDLGPSGLDGAVNGASLTKDRFGRQDKAYYFDGKGNTITVNGLCAKAGGDISFSFWTWSDTCAVSSVFMAVPDDPSNRLSIHYNYNHNFQNALLFDYGSIYAGGRIDSIPFTFSSAWTHIVAISSAARDSMYLYVNGKLLKKQKGHHTHSSDKVFSFGATSSFYYKGAIDEFRMYNRALSEAEVFALTNDSMSGIKPDQKFEIGVTAFPNPSHNGNFNLRSSTKLKSVTIYSTTGAMVREQKTIYDNWVNIDLTTEGPAIYVAVARGIDNKTYVIKLEKTD